MKMETKRTNRALLIGWSVFVIILFIMYLMEVVRGARTVQYMIVFGILMLVPQILAVTHYFAKPDSDKLQYTIIIGFSVMYGFVVFTSTTPVVWTYILPMLSLLVLYHNPKLITFCGILTVVLNISGVFYRYRTGVLEDLFDKDIRIQIFVLMLCFIALYCATFIYDSIYRTNVTNTEALMAQKDALNRQADELSHKNGQLREMTMQTIMTIANTIDAKDEYTRGHSRRVSEYSVAIAREMGYEEEDLRNIRFIGLLHDIGKIGVPDNVLNKAGKLTEEEYQLMKDHTMIGGEILKDITMIENLDIGAKYHHERYDGTGYPDGLKGEEIPLIARIIGVADAYDAMTSNRVYRRHLPQERVMEELKKGKGKQFDPVACEALLKLLCEDRLPKLDLDNESVEVKQTTKILTRVIDKAEETASDDVHYDELTGTLGRENGVRMIQNEIRKFGTGAIFVFDLDNFRKVNEKEGFVTGDRYLSFVADEIRNIDREVLVSRFGADEFVTYLPQADTAEKAGEIAEEFIVKIRETAKNHKNFEMLSVSIGITPVYTEKDRVMVLFENASKALFVAKQYGAGNYFYNHLESEEEDNVAVANSADLKHLMEALNPGNNRIEEEPIQISGFDGIRTKVNEFLGGTENLHIVMFTLRLPDEDSFSPEKREQLTTLLENAIQPAIRNVDINFKYSNVQYAVIFTGLDETLLKQLINRVMTGFYRANTVKGIEVHYDAANLREYLQEDREER